MKSFAWIFLALLSSKLLAQPIVLGGDRPARLYAEDAGDSPRKLLLFLHGYSSMGSHMQFLFDAANAANRVGAVALIPDGEADARGKNFWNATPECCNFYGSERDDVGYLVDLIAAAKERVKVSEVYILGHSNGGFMAYRMACERPDLFKGVIAVAGGFFRDESLCKRPGTVNILQVHGTADELIPYQANAKFPGAQESVAAWQRIYGCTEADMTNGKFDFVKPFGSAAETDALEIGACKDGQHVGLWTVNGLGHVTVLRLPEFLREAIGFLDR